MPIRSATPDDAETISALYADIRLDTVPVVHTVPEIAEWLREYRICRGSSFVFDEAGVILGWVDVIPGDLDQLYVRRGQTGKGIGKAMLDFAKKQSPEGLSLYTFQVNEGARRFYRREGFLEVELGDGTGNEEGQPDVRMEWDPTQG